MNPFLEWGGGYEKWKIRGGVSLRIKGFGVEKSFRDMEFDADCDARSIAIYRL